MALTRRGLLRAGAAAAAGLAVPRWAGAEEAPFGPVPRRVLGRTGAQISILGFGAANLGHAFRSQEVFDRVLGEALDLGIDYVDTAATYDISQERLGPIVKRSRERMFLASKTREQTREGALAEIEATLRQLQTDHLDLVCLHDVGNLDVGRVLDDGGALRGLQEARRRGWARFLGASGHCRPSKLLPVLKTGLLDVVMVVLNYFDQHTYAFETRVLPAAREHRCGIVAMKVFGGPPGWRYREPVPPIVPKERFPDALRYSLSLPDVATAVIGMLTPEQVRENAAMARAFRPLTPEEAAVLSEEGKALAARYGPQRGPAS